MSDLERMLREPVRLPRRRVLELRPERPLEFDGYATYSRSDSAAWHRDRNVPAFFSDTTTAPRPAWMDDPSLLPKSPPGRTP